MYCVFSGCSSLGYIVITTALLLCNWIKIVTLLNQACASYRPVHTWLTEVGFIQKVGVFVYVCLYALRPLTTMVMARVTP